MNECDLDKAFADKVKQCAVFRSWILDHTRFGDVSQGVRLLDEEQGRSDRKVWWKHWWCYVPETKRQGETDILLVFEIEANGKRFALHIENKKENGVFEEGQPEGYEPRARFMMNKKKYLNYSSFETVLIAPRAFTESNEERCALFGAYIFYEEIAEFIPEFEPGGSMT